MHIQELILRLQRFWADRGCLIGQPYDLEKGAGTMNPLTFFGALGPRPWNVAYVEPSRRPADGRYGENPFRVYKHLQMQVILKPSPARVQDLYIESLEAMGVDLTQARPALRGGQLGGPDPGRLGRGLAGHAGRHGDQPVHLLPAGGRHGLPPGVGRDHLRHRAHLHVPHRHRQHLRPHLGRGEDRRRRLPGQLPHGAPARGVRAQRLQLRARRPGPALAHVRGLREGGLAPAEGPGPLPVGLRAGAQDEPHLQRPGRPGRRLHHRAPRHHQAHPRPRLRLRPGPRGTGNRPHSKPRERG